MQPRRLPFMLVLVGLLALPLVAEGGQGKRGPITRGKPPRRDDRVRDAAEAVWNAGWARHHLKRAGIEVGRTRARRRKAAGIARATRIRASLSRRRADVARAELARVNTAPPAGEQRATAWPRVEAARARVARENRPLGRLRAFLSHYLPIQSDRAAAVAALDEAEAAWSAALDTTFEVPAEQRERRLDWALAEHHAQTDRRAADEATAEHGSARADAIGAVQQHALRRRALARAEQEVVVTGRVLAAAPAH